MNIEDLCDLTKDLFGKTRAQCTEEGICVCCHGRVGDFRDERSRHEYRISGMCQECQDAVFCDPGV